VRTHDVANDVPPSENFDLAHARLVLVHVPGRDAGLRNMVSALRPGGWIVLEDFDTALVTLACPEDSTPAEQRANKIRRGFLELLSKRGVDLEYGRKLPRLLREAGLEAVDADAYFPVANPACRLLEQANTAQVADGLVAMGLTTRDEINDHLASLAAGEFDVFTPPLISAWGRKP
jgi:SAM-dependent methyltransferase